MVFFSVIVPVYKVEDYLERCIKSILQQTYKNFELILVDDGSPYNCGIMCDEFAKKDDRIIVIHQENAGLSAARNAGLAIARGKYILFVDSDDWILESTTIKLADIINKKNPDIIVFGYSNIYENKEEQVIYNVEGLSLENIKEKFVSDSWRNFACNKCFKSTLFNNKTFPEGGQCYEDLYLVPQLIAKAKNIYVLPDSLYAYNQNNVSSITKNVDSKKEYDFFLALWSNYNLAVQLNLMCQEECRCNALERAYTAILRYFDDKKLSEEKFRYMRKFCAEQMQYNLGNNKYKYKIYHNIAKLSKKENHLLDYYQYLFKYVFSKMIYKLIDKNK